MTVVGEVCEEEQERWKSWSMHLWGEKEDEDVGGSVCKRYTNYRAMRSFGRPWLRLVVVHKR